MMTIPDSPTDDRCTLDLHCFPGFMNGDACYCGRFKLWNKEGDGRYFITDVQSVPSLRVCRLVFEHIRDLMYEEVDYLIEREDTADGDRETSEALAEFMDWLQYVSMRGVVGADKGGW